MAGGRGPFDISICRAARFDAILNLNFLDRALVPHLNRCAAAWRRPALRYLSHRPGGRPGHPRNPDFMLQHYELRELLSAMNLVRYREGMVAYPDGKRAWRAAALAVRKAPAEPDGARDSLTKRPGVDIDLKERLIPMFRRLARPTLGAHVLGGIGGFGAMVALERRACDALAGAGVGHRRRRHQAEDRVCDRTPRHRRHRLRRDVRERHRLPRRAAAVLSRLHRRPASSKSAVALAIVKGVARGCALAGMSLVGGETAQMPGFYRPGEYDLAGFAVGLAERARFRTRAHPTGRRADRPRVERASFQRLLAGAPGTARTLAAETQRARGRLGLHARRRTAAADEHLREGRGDAVRALSDSTGSPISPAAA